MGAEPSILTHCSLRSARAALRELGGKIWGVSKELDMQAELERLRALPLEDRSGELEQLIQRLERELEDKSSRPPTKP